MRVYLDDERNPRVEQFDRVVRNYEEFKELLLTLVVVSYISFDHDLGEGLDGYDCAKLLVELDMEHNILDHNFSFNVHSANPVGAKNITAYLEGYLKCR